MKRRIMIGLILALSLSVTASARAAVNEADSDQAAYSQASFSQAISNQATSNQTPTQSKALIGDLVLIYAAPPEIDGRAVLLTVLGGAAIQSQDQRLYENAMRGSSEPVRSEVAPGISLLGDGAVDLAIAGAISLRDRETGYLAANSVVYAGLTTQVLKWALGVPRPTNAAAPEYHPFSGSPLESNRYSMPSGHTASAFALAHVLAKRYPEKRFWFYVAATAVGFSRVYASAHWPSDVAVGAVIGVWSAEQVAGRSRLFEVRLDR